MSLLWLRGLWIAFMQDPPLGMQSSINIFRGKAHVLARLIKYAFCVF